MNQSSIEGKTGISLSLLSFNLLVSGETDKVMNKWDNHNTIARGWAGMSKNYQPVTFRSIYNTGNKQETSLEL